MRNNFKVFSLIFAVILFGYFSYQTFFEEVLAQQVAVTATVGTSITCNVSSTSTNFGTIGPSQVYTSSPDVTLTVSCNPAAGCTAQVSDQGDGTNGGLYNSSANYLIPSPAAGFPATATLVAGTEGYGIQATTTSNGSGGTLSLNSIYTQGGNTVGKLSTTSQVLASSSQPVSGREAVVTHKVAISYLTPAGSYSDQITYTCVSN